MKNLFKNNDNDMFGGDADGNRRGQRQYATTTVGDFTVDRSRKSGCLAVCGKHFGI